MGYKITNKRKFNRFLVILFIITMFLTYVFTLFNTESIVEGKSYTQNSIIVKNGDTLWNIAEKLNYNKDIRETIYEIKELNKLSTSFINPGDKLLLP